MCGIVYLEDQLEAAHGAGYCDGFAGDVVGVFRGEECDGGCDVFGFTESAEWDDADACVDMFPGFESELFASLALDQVRGEVARVRQIQDGKFPYLWDVRYLDLDAVHRQRILSCYQGLVHS